MKKCLHCGKQLRDDSVKCFFCGELADELPQSLQSTGSKWEKNKDVAILVVILFICFLVYVMKR